MQDPEAAAEIKKKRTFRKFSYRGIDLDQYVAKYTPLDRKKNETTTRNVLATNTTTTA